MTLESEIGRLVRNGKDVEPHHIPTAAPATGAERFMTRFKAVQEQTATDCLRLAEWFEATAVELRQKAEILNHQATDIPTMIFNAANFEGEVRNRFGFLRALRDGPSDV